MPRLDLVVEVKIGRSSRARQLEGMFDVPAAESAKLEWSADVPIEAEPWNVGLIVGPSGAGKTQCARQLFGKRYHPKLTWNAASVVDDFAKDLSIEAITGACQSVGFNTIPAWLRPQKVLSNGEQFRVDLARRLLELPDPIVVDEFSSVVDRQVAKIASHAVAKFVRKHERQFVAVSCHRDIIEWLQPDWIFEPATGRFERRSLRPRPTLEVTIQREEREDVWPVFAPFHYLTRELHRAARCYVARVDGELVSFAGLLHRPSTKRGEKIYGISRIVTLPDWQGLGLSFHLADAIGAALRRLGYRLRMYPAHPPLIRAYDRSPAWRLDARPARFGHSSTGRAPYKSGRPNAVFEYVGPKLAASVDDSRALWEGEATAVCPAY